MTFIAKNRKQRLRTLENHIRKCSENIHKSGLEIGRYLCEIRDDELWMDNYDSWDQYLKDRAGELVGKSFKHAKNLIQAAEIAKRIPESIRPDVRPNLTASAISELGRLAPTVGKDGERGKEKDYNKLKKADVARVLKTAAKESDRDTPSVRDIRKAVDSVLGVDRKAEAQAKKEKQEERRQIDLDQYLRSVEGKVKASLNMLQDVPEDSWKLLEDEYPGLVTRVAEACETLAEFLRS